MCHKKIAMYQFFCWVLLGLGNWIGESLRGAIVQSLCDVFESALKDFLNVLCVGIAMSGVDCFNFHAGNSF